MPRVPGVSVVVDDGSANGASYLVRLEQYETLRDRLDAREAGWVELESAFGDGRLFVEVHRIRSLFRASPGYCVAADADDEAQRLTTGGA